jgi:hypothetical protein
MSAGQFEMRIASLEGSYRQVSDRLTSIDSRLDGIDRRLDGIDHRLDGFDRRFAGFEARVDRLIYYVMGTGLAVILAIFFRH